MRFLSVCPESESKPECDLVDEVLETGWTYVPQEDEKRGLALAKDLKEFTSYYYERILTNNTQDCAAFAEQVSAENHDFSDYWIIYWTYTAAEKECAVATNKDYRQQSDSRTVSGSSLVCFRLNCQNVTKGIKGIRLGPRFPVTTNTDFNFTEFELVAPNFASKCAP